MNNNYPPETPSQGDTTTQPLAYPQGAYQTPSYPQQDGYSAGTYQQPTYQQSAYQQNAYQQSAYQQSVAPDRKAVVSIGEWLWTLLVLAIPCVNLVMMFVFAFGSQKENKRTFFKAYLIWMAVVLVISILVSVVLSLILGSNLYYMLRSMGIRF